MNEATFKALVLRQDEDGKTLAGAESLRDGDLPQGDVLVGVEYSTVPFILRGVRLIGVDSVMCDAARRRTAWQRLASDLPPEQLDRICGRTIGLGEVAGYCDDLLARRVRGRVLVDVNAVEGDR